MEQILGNSQAEGEILDCRIHSFGSFAAVYTLSGHGGKFSLSVVTLDSRGAVGDSAFIGDLSPGIEEAKYLFDAIASGGVTPCTVTDVLEDMICI